MNLDGLLRDSAFTRRDWMRCAALLGCSVAGSGLSACSASPAAGEPAPDAGGAAEAGREAGRAADAPAAGVRSADVALRRSPRRYPMKKSINLWAFPYPQRMSLQQCLELARRAGFDAIELNYDLENDLSPRASEKDLIAIRTLAEKVGIEISGLCSFLFWPYPFTASRQETRERAVELAGKMIEAAHLVGTDNLLVVPGAVYIPWIEGSEEIPYPDADRRAREAVRRLLPLAEKHEVRLNIENIFFNAYLMSPPDLIEFVDSFESPWLKVHFDTGNIMPLQFPEHWIPMLGGRIRNVHLKEFSKKGTDVSLEAFRPLLDGTTNWPAVMAALDEVGYRGYVTFEYFHPFAHYPEALIYQTSDAMDRMLGRTTA